MKLVVFGLTISSAWGNGHATLWRGLCKSLARQGHRVVFFERDVPYYAQARDGEAADHCKLILYDAWSHAHAQRELADADAAIVTSYCPDAADAHAAIHDAHRPISVFYDMDTPVTIAALRSGSCPSYIASNGLSEYDLVLSFTGGAALHELRDLLGARHVRALHGHVDPDVHRPVPIDMRYRADLSWLGTFAADRQAVIDELFLEPARRRPQAKFLIAGAQYPADYRWSENVYFVRHLPPQEHAAFMASSRLTLNATRAAMAECGWCPSGRMFEAAACGATILSDHWRGIEAFYTPGEEILIAHDADDTLAALDLDDATLKRIGAAARERTLAEHTSDHRAAELVRHLEEATRAEEIAVCGA
jgi:spore maturation protein CgeB